MELNSNITLFQGRTQNTKASEEYVHVLFKYPKQNTQWDGWIPVEYRRTGVSIPALEAETLTEYLNRVYSQMDPSNYESWKKEQVQYWEGKKRSTETKRIFDILSDGKWHCRNCEITNPNFARRIQDLKDFGYTISTHLNYHCPKCGNNRSTRLLLLPIRRIELAGNGYETWSETLRKKIIKDLDGVDVYENRKSGSCLPDHKFSEIRWDEHTKSDNPEDMTDAEIRDKFQLLSNQRNQQKREVCRKCFQTGQRGTIYGIPFYYQGGSQWDPTIPQKGKAAEMGCIGCPWYDIARWRKELLKQLTNDSSDAPQESSDK